MDEAYLKTLKKRKLSGPAYLKSKKIFEEKLKAIELVPNAVELVDEIQEMSKLLFNKMQTLTHLMDSSVVNSCIKVEYDDYLLYYQKYTGETRSETKRFLRGEIDRSVVMRSLNYSKYYIKLSNEHITAMNKFVKERAKCITSY